MLSSSRDYYCDKNKTKQCLENENYKGKFSLDWLIRDWLPEEEVFIHAYQEKRPRVRIYLVVV
jgi:hypothetical protein